MARDWVKLHTEMLDDADIQELSPEHFRTWINLILKAGLVDDFGRAGRVANVARALHVEPAALKTTVAALPDHLAVKAGAVHVLNWHKWQSQSPRERKIAERAKGNGKV